VDQPPLTAEADLATQESVAVPWSFYGWRIVSASFVVQFVTMGTTFYSFGVLLKPLAEELSVSRFAIGSALPLMMLTGALSG
jgi:hypothetical protein